MTQLAEHIAAVRQRIDAAAREAGRNPADITLVAATKTQTGETIREAIACGITVCGENRVQELTDHLTESAYTGAALHFIGHLQTNKVKYIVGKADLIQSVDSPHLMDAIEARAAALDLRQDILLEVNIGGRRARGLPPVPAHGFGPSHRPLPPYTAPRHDVYTTGCPRKGGQSPFLCTNGPVSC